MPAKKTVRVVAHTMEEGGRWITLPRTLLIYQRTLEENLTAFPIGKVEIAGLVVHSLRTDKGDEWDIYNGWRKPYGNSKSKS